MGWSAEAGFDDRSAQIHARAAEDITDKGSGGTLHFATTPVGSTGEPVDRIIIGSEGNIGIGAAAPQAALHVLQGRTAGLAEDYLSNEQLEPGDYLTPSSTPGVAMKATPKGAVVGKALQPFSGKTMGTIKMLTDVTWYQP